MVSMFVFAVVFCGLWDVGCASVSSVELDSVSSWVGHFVTISSIAGTKSMVRRLVPNFYLACAKMHKSREVIILWLP